MFLVLNFECFTKDDAFCSHSFDYACLRRLRYIVMKWFEVAENFYSFKALLKMAGVGDASPISAPLKMIHTKDYEINLISDGRVVRAGA